MIKPVAIILTSLFFAGCSGTDSIDLPITNNTNVSHIECRPWIKQGSNRFTSTCLIDNADGKEKRPLKIAAYDAHGTEIGTAFIGKVTIGQKIRVNKTMPLNGEVMPSSVNLEIAN